MLICSVRKFLLVQTFFEYFDAWLLSFPTIIIIIIIIIIFCNSQPAMGEIETVSILLILEWFYAYKS